MVNGFCQSTIVVDGFFYMWTIGANCFPMVFQISTIGINGFSNGFSQSNHCHWMNGFVAHHGLSMVLGKVKADSQKRPKNKKKPDMFNKYLGVNNL